MHQRTQRFRKKRWGQVTTWAALFLFVLAATPLPLLVSPPDSEATPYASQDATPYPCQGGACGCNSAQKCWTSCCCLTPEQRRNWAESKGIEPPEYAVLSSTAPKTTQTEPVQKSCCAPKSQPASKNATESTSTCEGLHGNKAEKLPSCCASKKSPKQPTSKKVPKKNRSAVVILIDAAKCNGLSFDMTCLNAFVLPTPVLIPTGLSWSSCLFVFPANLPAVSVEVPTPPPRD